MGQRLCGRQTPSGGSAGTAPNTGAQRRWPAGRPTLLRDVITVGRCLAVSTFPQRFGGGQKQKTSRKLRPVTLSVPVPLISSGVLVHRHLDAVHLSFSLRRLFRNTPLKLTWRDPVCNIVSVVFLRVCGR